MAIIKLPWTEFKNMVRDKKIPIQRRETENAHELMLPEGSNTWVSYIFKENDPNYVESVYLDYQDNYASLVNLPLQPRSEDGRILMQPVTLDKGIWHWFCGAGDDPVAGKAGGQTFMLSSAAAHEVVTASWHFNDWVALSGGVARYRGANLGDVCNFTMYAPASVATPNETGTGNCNKVPTGLGFNVIVPAAGDGAFDVDLENDVTPIPNEGKGGLWDWSWPDEGRGTFLPAPGHFPFMVGHYDFYDVPIPMIRFIANVPLLGQGQLEFNPQNPHPTYILPHWQMVCTLTRGADASTPLEFIWYMMTARKKTT